MTWNIMLQMCLALCWRKSSFCERRNHPGGISLTWKNYENWIDLASSSSGMGGIASVIEMCFNAYITSACKHTHTHTKKNIHTHKHRKHAQSQTGKKVSYTHAAVQLCPNFSNIESKSGSVTLADWIENSEILEWFWTIWDLPEKKCNQLQNLQAQHHCKPFRRWRRNDLNDFAWQKASKKRVAFSKAPFPTDSPWLSGEHPFSRIALPNNCNCQLHLTKMCGIHKETK